ncbi:MAG: hypothetical protein LBE58_18085 [Comamonas sp.]|jgi:hypothetical protein|nr:hypothetical protein [Comamonas sp.]
MTITHSLFAHKDPSGARLVDDLPNLKNDVNKYREAMHAIGKHLGDGVLSSFDTASTEDICVVCTVEDADFLARGVIEALEGAGYGRRVHLICLWNERIKKDGISASPVVKQYQEKFNEAEASFIIVKSIISGACVVKTNLTRVLSYSKPKTIFVAAPVLLQGAEERLSREFPEDIARRFNFVHFSTHTDKSADGEEVIPGIGGSVYKLLGLGDSSSKNKYLPNIVKERRQRAFPAVA